MTRLRPLVVELGKYGCVSNGCQVLDSYDVVVFLFLFSFGLGRQGFTRNIFDFYLIFLTRSEDHRNFKGMVESTGIHVWPSLFSKRRASSNVKLRY